MKVPSLIEFYNNQNQLAVQAAGQTASNQTSANIESARLGMEAKRLSQEKQLEHFRVMMQNMREARAQSAAEGISSSEIEARKQAAILSQTFEGSQNAAKMSFEEKLAAMNEAGAQQRQLTGIEANREELGTRARTEVGLAGLKAEAEAPYQAAQTRHMNAQADLMGSPDVEGAIQSLTALATNRKEMEKTLGKDQYKKVVKTLSDRVSSFNIDPNTIPEVVEARAPEIKAKYESLLKSTASDFTKMQKQGSVQYIQQAQVELQNLIAQGLIRDPKAAVAKLYSEAKRLRVTAEDLS